MARTKRFEVEGEDNRDVDPSMCFRVLVGHTGISYDKACGFDVEQLEILFPEEVHAFKRWESMHEEYTASKNENDFKSSQKYVDETQQELRGHFYKRLAQFDARTNQMKYNKYMFFSKKRTGSFLGKSKSYKEKRQWENSCIPKKKGRLPLSGLTWESYPVNSIKFLHWLGFDPKSELKPPNTETTRMLGFLAYDFFGKIIEKALKLKLKKQSKSKLLLELEEKEQLNAQDLKEAIDDAIYIPQTFSIGASSHKKNLPSLYFGPGFEQGLEMELQSMLSNSRGISPTELQIRKQEDELFQKIASPPKKLETILHLLENPPNADEEVNTFESQTNSNKHLTLKNKPSKPVPEKKSNLHVVTEKKRKSRGEKVDSIETKKEEKNIASFNENENPPNADEEVKTSENQANSTKYPSLVNEPSKPIPEKKSTLHVVTDKKRKSRSRKVNSMKIKNEKINIASFNENENSSNADEEGNTFENQTNSTKQPTLKNKTSTEKNSNMHVVIEKKIKSQGRKVDSMKIKNEKNNIASFNENEKQKESSRRSRRVKQKKVDCSMHYY